MDTPDRQAAGRRVAGRERSRSGARRHRRPARPRHRRPPRRRERRCCMRAGARDLAEGAGRRRGRVPRPHPGDAEAGGRPRRLRLRSAGCRRARSRHRPGASSACSASTPRAGRAALAEDRLLSDHIVPTAELDPLPVAAADRRDFATILATTGEPESCCPAPAGTRKAGCSAAALCSSG